MIATAALAEAGFRAQAVAKWRAVYWMTVAFAGRSLTKALFAFRTHISGAKSEALFDPLRAK